MKGIGIFLVAMAGLNLLVALAAIAIGSLDLVGTRISGAFMVGSLGAFLICRADEKKKLQRKNQKMEKSNADRLNELDI